MSSVFDWVNFNRADVMWMRGPDSQGLYHWDGSLPNQQQIVDLVASFDPQWQRVVVPQIVQPRQIRLALVASGISLEGISQTIDALPEPNKTVAAISWEYAVEIRRDNALVAAVAHQLSLTTQQVDNIFILAATCT